MLDIFRWKCTINVTFKRHFLCNTAPFFKKEHEIASPVKFDFSVYKALILPELLC